MGCHVRNIWVYKRGPKNKVIFFLEGRGAVLPSAPEGGEGKDDGGTEGYHFARVPELF